MLPDAMSRLRAVIQDMPETERSPFQRQLLAEMNGLAPMYALLHPIRAMLPRAVQTLLQTQSFLAVNPNPGAPAGGGGAAPPVGSNCRYPDCLRG